jgi:hypothetical protein
MERRALLRRVAGLTVAGGLAGCLSTPGPGAGDPKDTSDPTTGPGTTPDGRGPVIEELTVGSRDDVAFPDNHLAHELDVVNDADEEREVSLRLTTSEGEAMVEETWSMSAGARVHMRLLQPQEYTLAVTLAEGEVGTVLISAGLFDCNDSRTTVDVKADGTLDDTTISTELACPPTEVTETELSVIESGCADEEAGSATVSSGDEKIDVDGTIRVPNPCYGADLDSAIYGEPPGDTLTVRVAQAEPDGDQACVECVGAVSYEATISLANDYPGTVVIEHEHFDRVDEVARVAIDE